MKILNQKWLELIKIRNVCNISIEEKRASKEIGSSLEASLKINLDKKLNEISKDVDFSELMYYFKCRGLLFRKL